ncbi:M3 family metallopeptidase [Simiduia sp. 21SJ11W-1]|uniref:M3 family metallopeptidase n=1 Tax=Simiduia sp. 21SJ11W-1 TaxID=2909669 RepID=UPI0020A12FC1|nr:M3 family metallopeptidase [Simiduia sp. 21SJ11W-1]UTA47915.1 M3 family metallopeptidase [Simiduia sp. 21SJ11W-1]
MPQATQNALLADPYFPPFGDFSPADAEAAVDSILADNRAAIDELVANAGAFTSEQLLRRLEAIDDRLSRAWSPVSHLNSVQNSEALRAVYERCLQKLTAYSSEMGQHEGLFALYQTLTQRPDFEALSQAHKQSVNHALRDFTLAGIGLAERARNEYKALKARLSELSNTFSNNVLDATQGWHLHITDQADLAGLPDHAIAQAQVAAKQKKLEGWVITLDFPAYHAAMTYAENRAVREQVYRAYSTRASEFGPAGRDNGPLIVEILQKRQALASLLGYEHYAALSLAKKMADTPANVLAFLEELARESRPVAEREFANLQTFARDVLGLETLEPWDVSFASEKLKQRDFEISQQQLRPYFPAQKVIDGMFAVVHRLFGISVKPVRDVAVWHDDVQVYAIEKGNETLAYFYLDLYARADKRGGAWMDDCRVRRKAGNELQKPVAYLTCNFSQPLEDTPSLLTFDEVTTLFHEFGHGLHHMLTQVDVAAVSGINGVPWDAVELPSQFLENWCWEPEVIPMISGHYQTGAPLPAELLEKMLAARHFHTGLFMVRQLEFALFDFELHMQTSIERTDQVQAILDGVRQRVAVAPAPAFNRFQNSFSHIFAGGYAAGYYSYKWAEVLSADAYSRFEEDGVFNAETGQQFFEAILSQGGARDALSLFTEFRGRAPSVEPLLRHSGIRG